MLARLDACAGETWDRLSPVEIATEHRLQSFAPARLPDSLMASLEATLREVRFPNEEKIVPFPKLAQPAQDRGGRWWGAAAAVAITGALSALLIPTDHSNTQTISSTGKNPGIYQSPAREELIPAGFNRGLSEAVDEGVIWQQDSQPHRVLKVIYKDLITLKDSNGGTYQVEQPRVEYILVPAKTD